MPEAPLAPPAPALPGIADERVSIEAVMQREPLALGAASVLQSYCADCHGGDREGDVLGDPTDIAALIARGRIVPGAAAESPLLHSILAGRMPPPPRSLTPGELDLLTRFIDQLPAGPAAECQALPLQSTDVVYATLLADVLRAPEADRPFLRYAGLTYASNAGWCGTALERQLSALFALVNSASTGPEVVVPRAIDENGLLYRIDVRDYGWERSIAREEGASAFDDGWDAIVASAGVYALELRGNEADQLKLETGTPVPYLAANALLHAAAGEAYYSLLGVPSDLYEMDSLLGIGLYDYETPIQQAGFATRRADVPIFRTEQRAHPGRYYWLIGTNWNQGSGSIFEDPLSRYGENPAVLFHLPNGLFGFHLESGHRNLSADLRHSPVPEVAGCFGCHQPGVLPITDKVRAFVEENTPLFASADRAEVERNYVLQAELDALIQSDNQLHLSASERAGLIPGAPDPLSYVYYQFELDTLSLPRVAAELDVTPEQLQAQLPNLQGQLQPLQDPAAGIPRRILEEAFVANWCILHPEGRNRPVSCLE